MSPLAKGILTALVMAIGVGPGVLINFHTSLRRGFRAGLSVVAGLYTGIIVFLAVNYFGVFRLIQPFQHRRAAGIICGAILCCMGIGMLLTRPNATMVASEYSDPVPLLKGFLSGFLINITNPFIFLLWATLMSFAAANFGYRSSPFFAYLTGVIATGLCLDIVKSYFFSRIKAGVTARLLALINRGMGTVLASGGIFLVCRSIFVFG